MLTLFRRPAKSSTTQILIKKSLRSAGERLRGQYRQHISALKVAGDDPRIVDDHLAAAMKLSEATQGINQLLTDLNPEMTVKIIRQMTEKAISDLTKELPGRHATRQALAAIITILNELDLQIVPQLHQALDGSDLITAASSCPSIVIPSDSLYQAHASLFPAERMLVASGRSSDRGTELGAVFEVTGKNTTGHVWADPERLARALVAMSVSATHLAAWIHSQPGRGPGATQPSVVDFEQHQRLGEHYQDLIGIILVEDGWIRFWGDALVQGQVNLSVVGAGIVKENMDEHLYRLVS
jgi:hypothetical protein